MSSKKALVLGRKVHAHLLDRKDEQLEFCSSLQVDHEAIKHRLEEVLDAARKNGMSGDGLKWGEELISGKAYNV